MTLSRRATLRQMLAFSGLSMTGLVAGCARTPVSNPDPEQLINGIPFAEIDPDYGLLQDGEYTLPPIPPEYLQGVNRRAFVSYPGSESAGAVDVDPHAKFLYWVMEAGQAIRYPISVGREGRGISGNLIINHKREWPGWTPTQNMLNREPEVYGQFRGGIPGGLASPLGARALYLYRGGRDTYYRIHGTNDLTSIGNSGSAGCIRLFNHDAIDLFNRVPDSTRVSIRSYLDSVRIEGEALANRGVELPPVLPGQDLLDARVEDGTVL